MKEKLKLYFVPSGRKDLAGIYVYARDKKSLKYHLKIIKNFPVGIHYKQKGIKQIKKIPKGQDAWENRRNF